MTEVGVKERTNPNTENFPLIGGIAVDFKAIASSPTGEVTVKGKQSNDPIIIAVNSYKVDISTADTNYYFIAEWYDGPDSEDFEQIPNTLGLNMRTILEKDGKRIRHPDFRVRELANEAITYFEEIYGPLQGIDFMFEGRMYLPKIGWVPASDNYVSYFAEKKKALAEGMSEEEAMKRGALASWSGRNLAIPLGLTRVEVEEIDILEGTKPDPITGMVQAGQQEIYGRFLKQK